MNWTLQRGQKCYVIKSYQNGATLNTKQNKCSQTTKQYEVTWVFYSDWLVIMIIIGPISFSFLKGMSMSEVPEHVFEVPS